uniref:Uncharacterized protein n=1 Tax=Ficedula albicollis TaxID=59894 RepID=A0A803VBL3_FICAL
MPWLISFPLVCKSCALRRFSIQPAQQRKIPNRYLGQPSPFTHPHLLKPGEVWALHEPFVDIFLCLFF